MIILKQKRQRWIVLVLMMVGVRALSRRMAAMLVAAALVSTSLVNRVEAAAGDLDPTFGSGGTVLTSIGPDSSMAFDVAVQADGKIVAVGLWNGDLAIARYNPDGTLDAAFGSGGKVTTDFAPDWGIAFAMAIQSNGKIVVGGSTGYDGSPSLFHIALARYNTDGSLDATFGDGGIVVTAFNNYGKISDLVIQPDGRIIAIGRTSLLSNQQFSDLVVLRYNASGSLDTSFSGGIVEIDFFAHFDGASGVVIQPDGRILVGGTTNNYPNQYWSTDYDDFLLLRLNTNGSLDTTFGAGGKVVTDFFGKSDFATAVALQPDGRILLGGTANNGFFSSFALARYNPDGSLDTTFGSNGKYFAYFYPITPCYAEDMALLPNGKIVLAGNNDTSTTSFDFMLARFNSDGSLDSFGSGNHVLTDFSGRRDFANAMSLYGNDQILALGHSSQSGSEFALARYLGDGTAPSADLGVTMSASPSGNTITYTITVNNFGAGASYYVMLKDTLPVNTIFVSFTAPQGWVVFSKPGLGQSGTVSVSRSKLINPHPPFPSSATFTLVVRVSGAASGTTISNRAYLSSSFTPDPYAANDRAISYTSVP